MLQIKLYNRDGEQLGMRIQGLKLQLLIRSPDLAARRSDKKKVYILRSHEISRQETHSPSRGLPNGR